MKNILAENMLRFGPKNLSNAEKNKLKRLSEQPSITSDMIASAGFLNDPVPPYGVTRFNVNQKFIAVKKLQDPYAYSVFDTSKSIIANNGRKKFIIGKLGALQVQNEEGSAFYKFIPDATKTVSGIFIVNDNVSYSNYQTDFDRSVDISTKDMSTFPINISSPRLNNLLISLFIQDKPDYAFTFKSINGYNETTHKKALEAVIKCIEVGNRIGLFNIPVPTIETLKLV